MAKTWLGRLLAESFAEQMFSNCNIVLTLGNMRMNPIDMGQLVVLTMNKRCMQYMKKDYGGEIATALGMECTIIADVDVVNADDADGVNPADVTLAPVIYS